MGVVPSMRVRPTEYDARGGRRRAAVLWRAVDAQGRFYAHRLARVDVGVWGVAWVSE